MRSLEFGLRAVVVVAVSLATSSFGASTQSGIMLQPGPPGYNRDACGGTATMVPGAAFVNGSSTAKYKFLSTCKGTITLSNLMLAPLSDGISGTGDEAICLVNFQSNAPGPCGSFALRGEIVGTLAAQKIKVKLNGPADLPGVCPLAPGADARITSLECFLPNPAYVAAAACPGLFTPMVSDPTQGLCFPSAAYIPNPPGTPVIAVQGLLF